ncbi:spire type actin nucleation factor [Arctopsyche grandis]|uniref:spire type actin nucleation factor n=1 Tax=Arctopsyche grandis TaxID=121162 RepID=UPI00406D7823
MSANRVPVSEMKSSRRVGGGGEGGSGHRADSSGCVSLKQVVEAFNAPISEEHAWALLHQGAVSVRASAPVPLPSRRAPDSSPHLQLEHLVLHKDGSVHVRTATLSVDSEKRCASMVIPEQTMVVNLALIVYQALDYAQPEDEERLISPDLERLIRDMTTDDDTGESQLKSDENDHGIGVGIGSGTAETDDEGIERDSGDVLDEPNRRYFTCNDVLERCAWHGGRGAAAHYQAVCRALVAEAMELTQFLARVRDGGAKDLYRRADAAACRELDSLRFSDWARFWMQVIGELRMGVKLKKVDFSSCTPIEYEMTPYEILMDDIRSRRYKLRKVDGNIPPRVKKDAHAMILEFIRSRPPLKKASERKLPPATAREATPREQLLDSIKRGRPLRPTLTRSRSKRLKKNEKLSVKLEISRDSRVNQRNPLANKVRSGVIQVPHQHPHPQPTPVSAPSPGRRRSRDEGDGGGGSNGGPQRRLIKVDFESFDDDDDEDIDDVSNSVEKCAPQPFPRKFVRNSSSVSNGTSCNPLMRTTYDLATQCPSRRASMRRHTVVACSKPTDSLGVSGSQSVPQSRPDSRQSGISGASSDLEGGVLGTLGTIPNNISWSRSSLQDELIQSVSQPCKKHWQDAMSLDDRLSLTLEEIVHIRSVLTKAELEALPVEGRVKEDVEKRKVCFLCLKTRFGIFGPWGQRCKLCKKTVCAKCYSKMRIPTEHFSNVPVVLLSPSLMPSPEDETNTSFPRSLMARLMSPETQTDRADNSVGSAPNSPLMQRSQASDMVRPAESALNSSPGIKLPQSCAQSAPGSRGGSSLGYVSEQQVSSLNSIMTRSMEGPQSLPLSSGSPRHTLDRRNRFNRGATLAGGGRASDRLRGTQMIVCHDCKTMVLQIIKSSRTSRSATRNDAIKNLTLDLSPVYN